MVHQVIQKRTEAVEAFSLDYVEIFRRRFAAEAAELDFGGSVEAKVEVVA